MSDPPLPEADRTEGHPHPRETSVLFGQHRAAQAFLDAWTAGRLHHAWLLRGPRGVGKATLAYRIARALIADPGDDGAGLFGDAPARSIDVPSDCPVQARILAQAEPRLFVLRRTWDVDKKRLQTQVSVDDVRAMRRFLSLSAADGGWRVIIADSADEMTRSAANALLKFLEEPPPRSLFLLLSHAPAGLLATIRSRCRTLDLAPLDPDALAAALEAAGAEAPAGAEAALAQLSAGSVGEALRLVARDGLALYARLVQMLGGGRADRAALAKLAAMCAGRDGADHYGATLDMLRLICARLARAAATGTPAPEAAPGEHALVANVAAHPQQAPLWAETLARITATTRHAVTVNLDPSQCVIDTVLEIDATLARARAVAA